MSNLTKYNVKLERAIRNRLDRIKGFCTDEDQYWDGYEDGLKIAETLSSIVFLELMNEEMKKRRS